MPIINYIGKNVKTYTVDAHSHDYWEIIYYTEGEGSIIMENGERCNYSKNQIVLVPPHLLHSNVSETGFKNIHFTVDNWVPKFRTVTRIDDTVGRDVLTLLNLCYKYYYTEVWGKSAIIVSLTELILNMLTSLGGNMHKSEYVERIEASIIENFSDPDFTTEKAYEGIPLSADYIRRQFIKEMGVSPLHFLINTRISFAQKLLLDDLSNYKIREIAEMCGFDDQLYFSRVFKKVTGFCPMDYIELPKVEKYNN